VINETVYVAGIGPNIGTYGFDARTGNQVFEHELGEYNPVISDGRRLYLTGTSGIRAFEHETRKDRKAKRKATQAKGGKKGKGKTGDKGKQKNRKGRKGARG
jgi:hypothetical protein